MREIEVKILEINREEVENKLLALGAKKTFEGVMKSIIFDYDDGSIINNKKLLRLRSEGDKNILCFKDKVSYGDTLSCDEMEISVSDYDKTVEILNMLGLKDFQSNEKRRVSYVFDDVHFDFDKHLGERDIIPEYMEIEAKGIKDIHKYAEILGFKKSDCKAINGWQVYQHYKNK